APAAPSQARSASKGSENSLAGASGLGGASLLRRQLLLDVLEDLVGVVLGAGDLVDLAHHALLVDDDRGSGGEAGLGPDAERLGGLLVGVGQQREGEPLLLGELRLGGQVVDADAQDDRV